MAPIPASALNPVIDNLWEIFCKKQTLTAFECKRYEREAQKAIKIEPEISHFIHILLAAITGNSIEAIRLIEQSRIIGMSSVLSANIVSTCVFLGKMRLAYDIACEAFERFPDSRAISELAADLAEAFDDSAMLETIFVQWSILFPDSVHPLLEEAAQLRAIESLQEEMEKYPENSEEYCKAEERFLDALTQGMSVLEPSFATQRIEALLQEHDNI
ncbi:hypothetical protein [Desulfovibrio cuneatus]|uniref:hypothetical protein n=1 Tax=Desulfovibrio cuneatus TaxID=159728 RepID=UPI0004882F17|nr:hypothetical protein [Desulfovibrio cuneatus]